jgi:hypothetical protein
MQWLGTALGISVVLLGGLQETKDPQDVLNGYLSDIDKANKSTTGGAKLGVNQADRTRLLAAAKKSFDVEAATSSPKVPKLVWEYHTKYLENLVRADKLFSKEDLRPERSNWLTACKTTLMRNVTHAKEPESPYTTDQIFEAMIDAVNLTKKSFYTDTVADLRTAGFAGMKTISQMIIPKANVPPGRDAKQHYTERLARIDKAFPVGNENDKMGNQEGQTALKVGAKSLFDRELAAALAK